MVFEQIIGLEVHCELKTHTKMFSNAPVSFGKEPNTMVHEIDMGMTGTMPVLNKRAVEFAIRVCYALHMDIDELLCFDRKNYYYSDLPKGFQITQEKRPIGRNGYLDIEIDGIKTRIEIERLHMEEDTAKQSHYDDYSLIDYNRAGIPLIEIVTKPTIRSGAQAAAFLEKLRQVFIYTDVSDAKMEEGSLRCDVNISLRPYGNDELGTRCEIKNLNSISYVQKAIDYEASRQERLLLQGKKVIQETRRFDELSQETLMMREKSDAIDYQYYVEPNIPMIRLDHQWVLDIKKQLPMMMDEREYIYIHQHHLSKSEAHILVYHKDLSDFYDKTIQYCQEYKMICHWLLGEVLSYQHRENRTIDEMNLTPQYLASLISLQKEEVISSSQAKIVLSFIMSEGKNPETIIEEKGMKQISDPQVLMECIDEILEENPQSVLDYAHGKNNVVGYFMGQIMKKSNGQVNPQLANQLLIQLLKERTQ